MKHLSNSIVATTSALALSLALVACGGGTSSSQDGSSQQTETQATKTYSHDAVVDPTEIAASLPKNTDYASSTDDLDSTDNDEILWWKDGEEGKGDALIFTSADNEVGMAVTFVHDYDVQGVKGLRDTAADLEIKDKHLITEQGARGEERTVDITFQDDHTCYDATTDATYIRSNPNASE